MTGTVSEKIKIPHRQVWGTTVAGLLPLTFFMLFLKMPTLAADAALRGLRLCAEVVIPSLFPFAVLSGMMIGNGLLFQLPQPFTLPFRKMLGLSHAGVCVLVPCVLCGFPMGASCVADAVVKGRIDRTEGERLLLFCNLPSPAFLIGTVGLGLWGSRAIGFQIYSATLIAAALVGIGTRQRGKNTKTFSLWQEPRISFSSLLTSSLTGAAQAMLSVCACVVFFTAIAEVIRCFMTAAEFPLWIALTADYLLELSGAASRGVITEAPIALLLCAFGAGWSGFSVHCQVLAVCESKGVKIRGYFGSKLLQGILSAMIMGVFLLLSQ